MSQTCIDGRKAILDFLVGLSNGCESVVIAACLSMKQSDVIKILKQLQKEKLVSRNGNSNKWRRLRTEAELKQALMEAQLNDHSHTKSLSENQS